MSLSLLAVCLPVDVRGRRAEWCVSGTAAVCWLLRCYVHVLNCRIDWRRVCIRLRLTEEIRVGGGYVCMRVCACVYSERSSSTQGWWNTLSYCKPIRGRSKHKSQTHTSFPLVYICLSISFLHLFESMYQLFDRLSFSMNLLTTTSLPSFTLLPAASCLLMLLCVLFWPGDIYYLGEHAAGSRMHDETREQIYRVRRSQEVETWRNFGVCDTMMWKWKQVRKRDETWIA